MFKKEKKLDAKTLKKAEKKLKGKKSKGKKEKKKESFLKGIKSELKKVTWPSKKDVFKYCIATIIFCLIIVIFFVLLNLGLAVVKGIFQ